MTAKEYLTQYRTIQAKLRDIESMLRDIRKELEGIEVGTIRSPWPDGQPHGTGITDPTGSEAIRAAESMTEEAREELRGQLVDLELRELRARSELWRQRIQIEEIIGKVRNSIYHELLHRHYIEGQTFELIAVEMNYSWRHTIRLHGAALLEIEKILKK